jgi:hypothetical protein
MNTRRRCWSDATCETDTPYPASSARGPFLFYSLADMHVGTPQLHTLTTLAFPCPRDGNEIGRGRRVLAVHQARYDTRSAPLPCAACFAAVSRPSPRASISKYSPISPPTPDFHVGPAPPIRSAAYYPRHAPQRAACPSSARMFLTTGRARGLAGVQTLAAHLWPPASRASEGTIQMSLC